MELISIVGIVLMVIAVILIKKVISFLFKSLMYVVLFAGVYFFAAPFFNLPLPSL
jgi:hypothetical protein